MGVKIATKELSPAKLFNPACKANKENRSININVNKAKINSFLTSCFSHFGGLV